MADTRSPAPCRTESGFTLVEVTIALLLSTALFGMISQTVISVSNVSRENTGALRQESRRRDGLARIGTELRTTSLTGRDFSISPDGRRIRFATLLGATQVNGEVTGVWSPPVTIELRDGRVLREEDGLQLELARGIRELTFRQPAGESFVEVRCVTRYRDEDTVRTIRIYPNN